MWDLGEVGQKTLSAFVLARIFANEEHRSQFVLPSPGIFLNATIGGAVLPKVVSVPRSAVRGRNQIFVLNRENKLEIRDLMVARRTADRVFVTQGIADGEKVILTKLDMPIQGMNLELVKTSKQGEEINTAN
jgi:hypothetical protein